MSDFDVSEIRKLEQDLGRIPGRMVPPMIAAVTKSAKSVQDAMRAEAGGHAHFPHFPSSITSEVKVKAGLIQGEVGPDKALTQGALGNILYFGTSKNAPVLNINAGIDREAPAFEKAVTDAAGKLFDE